MIEQEKLEELSEQAASLEISLGGAGAMAAAFDAELRRVRGSFDATGRQADSLSRILGRSLQHAISGLVLDGKQSSEALSDAATMASRASFRRASKPIADHFGALIGQGMTGLVESIVPFSSGGLFSQGRNIPLQTGGVVGSPSLFPMRGDVGIMGEAGPEAILPARGADGRLGIKAEPVRAATPVSIVMNIATPDIHGFQRAQGQILADLGRAITRGQRNR